MIGQPAKYPKELVKALSGLFRKNMNVKAAYLAHYFNPERDEKPCTLIGIDAQNDWDKIVDDACIIASEISGESECVDFIQINNDSDVCEYMTKKTKPFYKKSALGGLFK